MSAVGLEHLRRLRRQAGHATPAATSAVADAPPVPSPAIRSADAIGNLRRMLGVRERRVSPLRPAPSKQRDLPGVVIADGLHLIEHVLPWDAMPMALDGAFAREESALPIADLLFFDTETTGLAGGTGTRAFMIGASDFVPGGLRIRQLLMAHMAAEAAMLETFRAWLRPQTRLVSYNGRCYDAPLLATRYRLSRRSNPLDGLAHLDLLYPTRRRYRGVWENCRLATIERNALGIVREDDLPGSEAPAAWLHFLRGGSSHLLKRVAAHNFQDVVTLARLMTHLSEATVAEAARVECDRCRSDAMGV